MFKDEIRKMLGSVVTVTVDRPLGGRHPNYPDMIYPVNYGYIKGIMAPDGDELDAYILGVDEPVGEFRGIVIAIIRREDDVEDKLVVAPEGIAYSVEEIKAAIWFQEQYFKSSIETPF